MSKIPSLHAVLQGWLLDGPLAAYVPAYIERLERGRYASSTGTKVSQYSLGTCVISLCNPRI